MGMYILFTAYLCYIYEVPVLQNHQTNCNKEILRSMIISKTMLSFL